MTYVFRRGRMGVNLRVFRFCMIFPCVSFVKDVLGGGRINYKCHTGVSLGWFEAADEADMEFRCLSSIGISLLPLLSPVAADDVLLGVVALGGVVRILKIFRSSDGLGV